MNITPSQHIIVLVLIFPISLLDTCGANLICILSHLLLASIHEVDRICLHFIDDVVLPEAD